METLEDIRKMTEDEINSPVHWLCVDCGVNTAPGLSIRAEIYKAFVVEVKESAQTLYGLEREWSLGADVSASAVLNSASVAS